MKKLKDTRFMVTAALLAALTLIATMVIKIQTPTFGYIHIGDGMVLICGFLLGPVYGGLTAGLGSMLADLFSGYAIWAPGTFLIKFATAFVSGMLYVVLKKIFTGKASHYANLLLSGIAGEACMVFGYFLYNIFVIAITNSAFDRVSLTAAVAESVAEIPFNVAQGVMGITIAVILLPILLKIPNVKS